MTIIEQLKQTYPNIVDLICSGDVIVQDDTDGQGAYIAKWGTDLPLPDGFVVGKSV